MSELFNNHDKLEHLFIFADRCIEEVKSKEDAHLLELATAALRIEDYKHDPRESSGLSNKLGITARKNGLNDEDFHALYLKFGK